MKTLALALAILHAAPSAWAAGLEVVGHVPGYQCMKLNVTDKQLSSRNHDNPRILAAPVRNAPAITEASSDLIVAAPLNVVNGYAEVLGFDGTQAWIAAKAIKPWTSSLPATCTPAMMSNGRLGFDVGLK